MVQMFLISFFQNLSVNVNFHFFVVFHVSIHTRLNHSLEIPRNSIRNQKFRTSKSKIPLKMRNLAHFMLKRFTLLSKKNFPCTTSFGDFVFQIWFSKLLYSDFLIWPIYWTNQKNMRCTFFYRQLGCLAFGLRFWPKISNSLATAQPQIGLFLSKQLIFAKSCKNQL